MDEYTADVWHDLLGDLDLADCRQAVVTVAKRQPFVSASEIRAEVKRARAVLAERARTEAAVAPVRAQRKALTDPRPLRETIREILARNGLRQITRGQP